MSGKKGCLKEDKDNLSKVFPDLEDLEKSDDPWERWPMGRVIFKSGNEVDADTEWDYKILKTIDTLNNFQKSLEENVEMDLKKEPEKEDDEEPVKNYKFKNTAERKDDCGEENFEYKNKKEFTMSFQKDYSDLEKTIEELEYLSKSDEDEDQDEETEEEREEREEEYEREHGSEVETEKAAISRISNEIAEEEFRKSLEGHEGERDIFGRLITKAAYDPNADPRDYESVPEWMRNLANEGADYNPVELQLGIKHEEKYHYPDKPADAAAAARANLDRIENYYSELGRWIESAKKKIKAKNERDVKILKALDISPPPGYVYDEAFNRLVKKGMELDVNEKEEWNLVKEVETDFRKACELETDPGEMSEHDLQKALLGESNVEVYQQDETGKATLLKCKSPEEAKSKAAQILEETDDQERWEKPKKKSFTKSLSKRDTTGERNMFGGIDE